MSAPGGASTHRWVAQGLALAVMLTAGCGPAIPLTSRDRSGAAPCAPTAAVHLADAAELAAFSSCVRLRSVTVRTGVAWSLSGWPALRELDGDLVVGPTSGVDIIDLAGLERVGGTLRIAGNGSLTGVFLPRLRTVGALEIEHNPGLGTVALPRLREVARLRLADNAELEAVSMNALTRIGELVFEELPRLSVLQLDALQTIDGWPGLSEVALPSLPADELDGLRRRVAGPAP